jgi:hypothetical protein
MRFVAIGLFVATMGFVPPKREVIVDITGVYAATGKHPDGSSYQGKATINRLPNDRYEIVFDMPSGVFRAICLRVRDVLGCAWGLGKDLTVAIWSGSSNAVWTTDLNAAVTYETSTGATVAPYAAAVQRVTWNRPTGPLVGWGLAVDSYVVSGFPSFRAGAAFYRIGQNGTVLVGDWMDPNMPDAGAGSETLTR